MWVLRPGGLFCVGERVEEAKERFNARSLRALRTRSLTPTQAKERPALLWVT